MQNEIKETSAGQPSQNNELEDPAMPDKWNEVTIILTNSYCPSFAYTSAADIMMANENRS